MDGEGQGIKPRRVVAVKCVSGLLYPKGEPDVRRVTEARLRDAFGRIERASASFDWAYTDYYRSISPDLARCFFSFGGLRHPSELAEWKKTAVALEAESGGGSGRRVNIDPGYLDGARLVLASTKDNAQRVYLRDDIYAEVTMCRGRNGWEKFRYTIPYFKSGVYDEFFDAVRADWRRDIRAAAAETAIREDDAR
jgi:hypothetical protein